ncbi:class I SAM-dependent methyltransferase [Inquilinus sp.]|jgi:SAM-dependent methyltransferase|uniref:class I SAM-dependent methyltransferase n=1 Tax=Inquilinus sp. TaxID=1932117 RepID=UPI0037842373
MSGELKREGKLTSAIRFTGTGPGARTRDGCSVELYRRVPADDEPEIVAGVVPAGGTVLDLGAGAGRVAHALVALGYVVTAVDNSAEMLAHVRGAETVLADIETLDLGRGFDAVLLASTLINFPEAATRAALLAACRRHVRPGGAVLIQRRSPDTFRTLRPGPAGESAGVRDFIDAVRHEGRLAHITVRSEAADAVWTQSFTCELIDDRQLDEALAEAGLRLDRWLDARRRWALAVPA